MDFRITVYSGLFNL